MGRGKGVSASREPFLLGKMSKFRGQIVVTLCNDVHVLSTLNPTARHTYKQLEQ